MEFLWRRATCVEILTSSGLKRHLDPIRHRPVKIRRAFAKISLGNSTFYRESAGKARRSIVLFPYTSAALTFRKNDRLSTMKMNIILFLFIHKMMKCISI